MDPYGYLAIRELLRQDPHALSVGRSAFGRHIVALRVGDGKGILLFGGSHAREWCTVPVVLAAYRRYLAAWQASRGDLPGADFLPMVNPDGVELARRGLKSAPPIVRPYLARINGGEDFSLWKANGRGVDPNVNFDAGWGKGKGNVFAPSPASYVGLYPSSERETTALVNLTLKQNYRGVLCYHCKGEVAYYGYRPIDGREDLTRHSEKTARALCAEWGYTPLTSEGSHGGYKDWYALTHPDGVCLTVEVGKDDYPHPYPEGDIPRLIALHERDGVRLAEEKWNKNIWS